MNGANRLNHSTWWLGLVQAVAAIFFGIAVIFWPGLVMNTFIVLFGAFLLTWGVVELVRGFMDVGRGGTWWLTLLFGAVTLGIGLYLVRHTGSTFNTVITLVGIVLIVRGILDIVAAFLEDITVTNKSLWTYIGIVGIVLGIIVLGQSASNGLGFVWLVGLYALLFGALDLAVAADSYHSNGSSRRR